MSATEITTVPTTPIYQAILASFASDQGTAIRATLKSAAVRDATTWSLVVNSLQQEHGSCHDVAPMARVALLAHSLSSESGIYDTGPYKPVRNLKYQLKLVNITPRPVDADMFKLLAMPLDTFVAFLALNTYYNEPPFPYVPTEVDRSWAAVPVSANMACSPYIHEFIAAHFASDLTYGTIAYSYTVTGPGGMTGTSMSVPSSNLAYVSGPKNIILVLLDSVNATSPSTQRVGTMNVPVFTGRTTPYPTTQPAPPPIVPLSFGPVWQAYYINEHIFTIRANLFQAWDYMCKNCAVDNTCGRALALAAELMVATPPGVYLHPQSDRPSYDTQRPLTGALVLTTEPDVTDLPIANGSPYKYQAVRFQTSGDGPELLRKMISGVNLAKVSALHIPPSGLETITVAHEEDSVYTNNRYPDARNTVETYSAPTCSTLKRLAVSMKLIETTTSHYNFMTADSIAAWMHMLSHALAASTSVFLQQNDIPTRDWTGYNSSWSDYKRFNEISTMKNQVLGSLVRHVEVEGYMTEWDNYDAQDFLVAYDGMDPYADRRWFQQTIVPTHFHQQWYEKLKFGVAPPVVQMSELKRIAILGRIKLALPLSLKMKEHIEYIMSTFNAEQYHPIMLDRTPNDIGTNPVLGSWLEQTQYQSNITSSDNKTTPDRRYLETMAQTESLRVVYSDEVETRSLYVVDSDIMTLSWDRQKPVVSPVSWPDPPSFMDVIEGAKNYVMDPALAALMGYTAGGPISAAVSAAMSIMGQAITDISKTKETKKERELILEEVKKQSPEKQDPPKIPEPAPSAPELEATP